MFSRLLFVLFSYHVTRLPTLREYVTFPLPPFISRLRFRHYFLFIVIVDKKTLLET